MNAFVCSFYDSLVANETTGGMLGQTLRYDIKVDGDTMTLNGPFSEVWARVR